MRRLSIVDLKTGHQPILNEDSALVLVANGEIYNSPELRDKLERKGHSFKTKSDVEVIPALRKKPALRLQSLLIQALLFVL
jgi:asparagine synthase (glutamine-hydrolysing)